MRPARRVQLVPLHMLVEHVARVPGAAPKMAAGTCKFACYMWEGYRRHTGPELHTGGSSDDLTYEYTTVGYYTKVNPKIRGPRIWPDSAGTRHPAARRSQACRRACPVHEARRRGGPAATPNGPVNSEQPLSRARAGGGPFVGECGAENVLQCLPCFRLSTSRLAGASDKIR